MSSFSIDNEIGEIKRELEKIQYYRNALAFANCPIRRQFIEEQLFKQVDHTIDITKKFYRHLEKDDEKKINRQTREFTYEELANFNGTLGKPAYVAVNGIVYDVSNEASWGGASHFGLVAGKDVTSQFNNCHGDEAILSKLPKVGVMKQGRQTNE
jgi:predicted heme/steroid binding protein